MNTATQIKKLRNTIGWTQYQAAAYLDVPLRTYQGWEGGRNPARAKIVVLALTYARHRIKSEGKTRDRP